jgi:hypothetical protein
LKFKENYYTNPAIAITIYHISQNKTKYYSGCPVRGLGLGPVPVQARPHFATQTT